MEQVKYLFFVLCLSMSFNAQAGLMMTLEGDANGDFIQYSLSGSDIAKSDVDFAFRGFGIDLEPGAEPFPSLFAQYIGLRTRDHNAFIHNVTRGEQVNVNGVFLQHSDIFGIARAGMQTSSDFSGITVGDEIEWSGTGIIELSGWGISFSDFIQGTYQGHTGILGGLNATLIIKESVSEVPEPATVLLLLIAMTFLVRKYAK